MAIVAKLLKAANTKLFQGNSENHAANKYKYKQYVVAKTATMYIAMSWSFRALHQFLPAVSVSALCRGTLLPFFHFALQHIMQILGAMLHLEDDGTRGIEERNALTFPSNSSAGLSSNYNHTMSMPLFASHEFQNRPTQKSHEGQQLGNRIHNLW